MKELGAISNNPHRLGPNQSPTQEPQTQEKAPTQCSRTSVLLQGHAGVLNSIPVCSSASSSLRCQGDDCCRGQNQTASRGSSLTTSHRLHRGSYSNYKQYCTQPGAGHHSGPCFTPSFSSTLRSHPQSEPHNIKHNLTSKDRK